MIKVFMIGNVGKSETKKIMDKFVLNFSMACKRVWNKKVLTVWVNCQLWNPGDRGKIITPGAMVALSGDLSVWKNKDGAQVFTVVVNEVNIIGMSSKAAEGEGVDNEPEDDMWTENLNNPF